MHGKRGPPLVDRLIAERAAAQHGVVSRRQLEAAGLREGGITHRLAAGRLHHVHRGVYAVGHELMTPEGRWMAGVLACGDGALLSHRCAAALWAIRPAASARVDITIPSRSGLRPRPGITIHRPRSLARDDVACESRIPVTSPARTLFDLAEVIPRSALERAVERAEGLRLFDLRAMRRLLDANPSRRGGAGLSEILDQYRDTAVTRSELEELFLDLCFEHGVPRPLVNARVGPYEVDFLWPEAGLIVETDGHSYHATRAAFERDRARDARLIAGGYRVLRFTYRQVTGEPEWVVRLVRSSLEGVG